MTDGSGTGHTLAAGTFSLGTGLRLPVDGGALQPLTAPLTFSPGPGGSLTLGRAYRGRILVDVVDGKLRAINIVPLEQYLYGVVPAEMPSSWLPNALAAQAVASRSYALATRQLAAPFDVYSDTRSQMYLGIGAEQPSTTAAVTATAGQVLLYKGAVATTVFFSTSGGETSSSADAWGGKPTPYLVSVPDPYDVISPFHDWGPVPVTAQTLAKALHVVGTVADVTTTLNLSGRVSQLDLTTLTPSSTFPLLSTVGANTVQGALGLRSTWFDVGVLSLSPPIPSLPVLYGSTVQLSGVIRGVGGVSLEQRPSSATWQPVGPVVTQTDGTVQLTETPTITTDYRLATTQAAAALRADQGHAGGHAGCPGGADDAAGHDHARAGGSPRPDPAAQPERNHVDDGRHGDGRPDRHLDDRSHRHLHRAAAAHRRYVPRRHRPRARLFARDLGAGHRERLMKRALLVALTAALVAAAPAAAFTPADPLAANQWYLTQDHAFDAWPTPPPTLAPVKVAIIDSGIDNTLPDFAGQIADARSFVGGSPYVDTEGHGTFVAGEIAAKLDSTGDRRHGVRVAAARGEGREAGRVDPADGGVGRDPLGRGQRREGDQPQPRRPPRPAAPEQRLLLAARGERGRATPIQKGVVVVAAVGNSDEAPSSPWNYASYPAALPHVIGVSALKQNGDVAGFSNRDRDLQRHLRAGRGDLLDVPARADRESAELHRPGLLRLRRARLLQRGGDVVRRAAGLRRRGDALRRRPGADELPGRAPSSSRAADDVNATNGCPQCAVGRDRFSGWGRLDVARAIAALQGPLPAPDKYETNDDAGTQAWQLWGKTITVSATLDYYDDPVDVYKVALGPGERLKAKLTASWVGADVNLVLWRPGTSARRRAARRSRSSAPRSRSRRQPSQHLTLPVEGARLVLRRGEGGRARLRAVHAHAHEDARRR